MGRFTPRHGPISRVIEEASNVNMHVGAYLLGSNVHVTNIEPGVAESEFSLVRF